MGHIHHIEEDELHKYHHAPQMARNNRAFIWSIGLNSLFVIVEFITGIVSGSLALISDAGHNLSDVAVLILGLLSFRLAELKPDDRYTYGYSKSTILVSLLNAIVLFLAVGIIIYEAALRFIHPVATDGQTITVVAGIGILINGISAWFFRKDKEKDLTIKSSYLHLFGDALVSAGVVIAGILISFTGQYFFDPAISIIVGGVIVYSAWGLLHNSLRLSLDGVPPSISFDRIREVAMKLNGIEDIHHIHVWALSTNRNALTAHVVFNSRLSSKEIETIKHQLKKNLLRIGIHHATLETEVDDTTK